MFVLRITTKVQQTPIDFRLVRRLKNGVNYVNIKDILPCSIQAYTDATNSTNKTNRNKDGQGMTA